MQPWSGELHQSFLAGSLRPCSSLSDAGAFSRPVRAASVEHSGKTWSLRHVASRDVCLSLCVSDDIAPLLTSCNILTAYLEPLRRCSRRHKWCCSPLAIEVVDVGTFVQMPFDTLRVPAERRCEHHRNKKETSEEIEEVGLEQESRLEKGDQKINGLTRRSVVESRYRTMCQRGFPLD